MGTSHVGSTKKAAMKEYNYAEESNLIGDDGTAPITVYVDGGWSKRSYGHNYDAASGVVSTR